MPLFLPPFIRFGAPILAPQEKVPELEPHEESKASDIQSSFCLCPDSLNDNIKFIGTIAGDSFGNSDQFTLQTVQRQNGLSSTQQCKANGVEQEMQRETISAYL